MEALIVDDDRVVREVLSRVLRRSGYEPTIVENGLAALAAIAAHSYGVIVCDIKMAFLDGARLYDELEAEYPELARRLVFISGGVADPEIQAAIERTGRPILRKPFNLNEFRDLVREVARGDQDS